MSVLMENNVLCWILQVASNVLEARPDRTGRLNRLDRQLGHAHQPRQSTNPLIVKNRLLYQKPVNLAVKLVTHVNRSSATLTGRRKI